MNTYYINTFFTVSFARSAFTKNALTVQKAFSLVSFRALDKVAALFRYLFKRELFMYHSLHTGLLLTKTDYSKESK